MTNTNSSELPQPDRIPGTAPSDSTTLVEVIGGYRSDGFAADFYVEAEEVGSGAVSVTCGECGRAADPSRVVMHSMRRLEGASDPDDMLAVVAVTCPTCGAQGTAVLGYGPMASAEDGAVLAALQDRRDDDVLPGDSPATESPTIDS